jgi:catechol 2,3-dioxygenase-like lactoylglutathione lyase family enzyme
MQVTGSVVCFTVEDVPASVRFLVTHFGFGVAMEFDGFASLKREDMGVSVVFHRRGLEVLPEPFRHERASGVILALVIADFDAEYARLQAEGVNITLPVREEAWGERLFLATDPNGIVVELVDAASVQAA